MIPTKALKLVSGVFSAVGMGMLAGSFFAFTDTRSFISRAVEAEGQVIALGRSRSSSGSGSSSTTYRPVVQFTSGTGKRIEFTSDVGSNPPSHRVGESVRVLYNPADPDSARIKSFFQLWVVFIIFFVLGLIFTAIGLMMILQRVSRRQRTEWLSRHGRRIQTALQGVELNRSLYVNGRSPYQIISQSSDPASNTVRVFQSENLWFNPRDYIKGQTIDVLVDPNDPKRYVMDVSFLPKHID